MIKSAQKHILILVKSMLALLILSNFILGSVPPVNRDALTHHLAVPKLWIEKGLLKEMPSIPFSYYPMNLDLLYTIPLLFGNDIIPKYMHLLFALGTAWLIYIYLNRRTTKILSMVGVLLFLSTPVIVRLSISVYVDLGLIFFSWASIFFLFKWARHAHSLKYLILSAIFCGLGLGTKYNGLIVLFLLTFFTAIIYVRSVDRADYRTGFAIGYSTAFFIIALVVFSPWMIRNYHFTGNPIYPLYDKIMNPESDDSTFSNMSMKPWMQRKRIYKESVAETALIPIRIFFQGKDDDPRYFDGKLNPILFLCPLLILLKHRKKDTPLNLEQLVLASFSILFLLYACFMVDIRIRYISPIIPPLVILSVFGVENILRQIDGIGKTAVKLVVRGTVIGVVIFFFFLNGKYFVELYHGVNPLPYISGKISREEYIVKKLPDYPAIEFINHMKHDDVKILALFLGDRMYYFDKPVEFGISSFRRMVVKTATAQALTSALHGNSFTHCIMNTHRFENWANSVFYENQKQIISDWMNTELTLLFSKNGYAVFKLGSNF